MSNIFAPLSIVNGGVHTAMDASFRCVTRAPKASYQAQHIERRNYPIALWQLQILFVLLNQNILLWNSMQFLKEIWSFHILSNSNLSPLSRPSRRSFSVPIPCLPSRNTAQDVAERRKKIEYSFCSSEQLIDTPINAFDILTILLLKIVSVRRENGDCCFWYCGTWADLNIDPVRWSVLIIAVWWEIFHERIRISRATSKSTTRATTK